MTLIARLLRPLTKMSVSIPAAIAYSAAYRIKGLSTIGNNSFGIAFVAGKKRVPKPATGKTAFRIFFMIIFPSTARNYFSQTKRRVRAAGFL